MHEKSTENEITVPCTSTGSLLSANNLNYRLHHHHQHQRHYNNIIININNIDFIALNKHPTTEITSLASDNVIICYDITIHIYTECSVPSAPGTATSKGLVFSQLLQLLQHHHRLLLQSMPLEPMLSVLSHI